jgi:putative SOS response-associated peptidase YedK
MKWGISSSSSSSSGGYELSNARAETLVNRSTFKQLLASNRCVFPVNGYYEWKRSSSIDDKQQSPQPYYFHSGDKILYLAALYTRDCTFTVITTNASAEIMHIHHRMPVLLDKDEALLWINAGTFEECKHLLRPKEVWFFF